MNSGRGNPFVVLLTLVFVVVVGFGVVGYTLGWINLTNTPERTTIEFDKTEMKADTQRAAEATEEVIEDTGETLEEAGESLESDETLSDESEASGDTEPATP